jgi:type VI secretion system protein ImpE
MTAPRAITNRPYHDRMSPTELFQEARLDEALAAQRAIVESRPDDVSERLLLCEFLAFTGKRDEVRQCIDEIKAPPEVRDYIREWRQLLAADDARHAGVPPQFLIDPPAHVLQRLKAAELFAAGRDEEARELLDDADELAAWVEGYVDGRAFDGWRDADDLLGPIIEAFYGERYLWIPIEQVRKLRLEEGDELRDAIYRPTTAWLGDGRQWEVFIPALYAGTAEHLEEGIRTGAGVDWVDRGGVIRGLGSRTYLFGEEELSLTEFRQVEVRHTSH